MVGMKLQKRYLVSFGVSVLILLFLLTSVDIQQVVSILENANMPYVIFGMFLTLMSISCKVIRWKFFLDAYKLKIKWSDVWSIFLAAHFLANTTPARVGEASRPYFLKRRYKTSYFHLLPTIILERVLDVLILLVYSLVFLLFFYLFASFFIQMALLVITLILLFVILVFFKRSIANYALSIFFRMFGFIRFISKLKPRAKRFIYNFYEGVTKVKSASFVKIIFFTALPWLIESFTFFIAALSLGVNLPMIYCVGFISLAVLGGTLSSLPGGLGSTELILFGFLVFTGLSQPMSLSITLLYRLMTFWTGALLSAFFFLKEINLK